VTEAFSDRHDRLAGREKHGGLLVRAGILVVDQMSLPVGDVVLVCPRQPIGRMILVSHLRLTKGINLQLDVVVQEGASPGRAAEEQPG